MRNDGPDAVAVRQVIVNDGYANFTSKYDASAGSRPTRSQVEYPWIEGEAYEITLLTSTGGTIAGRDPDRRRDPRGRVPASMA